MLSEKRIFFHILVIAAAFSLPFAAEAAQSVTVTVHPGNDHVFKGFGFNQTHWRNIYGTVASQEIIDSLLGLLYGPDEMGANYIRLFSHPYKDWDGTEMTGVRNGRRYAQLYQNIRTIQPDIQFKWCPWGLDTVQNDLEEYAQRMVRWAKEITDTFGIDFSSTGVFNEPQNDPERVDDKHIASLVLLFRDELDKQGLGHVKIIAPEASNVLDWSPPPPKGAHTALIDSIAANPAALAAVDAWGYHSYNYGPAWWFRNKMRPYGMELWQTESGMHGSEGGPLEVHYAAQQTAIALSDINLLANRWFYYLDIQPRMTYEYDTSRTSIGDAFTMIQVSDWPPNTHHEYEGFTIETYLKFHYMRQLGKTFRPNTEIRLCTSDLQPWKRNDQDRFTYMENTNRDISGELSQVCAAAGRRSDSSWVLATVNRTGLPGIDEDTVWRDDGTYWMKHEFAPADSFMVTFDVAELTASGEVDFSVTRCNMESKCFDDGTVTMVEGRVTIPTAPMELVTLKSGSGIPITAANRFGKNTPGTRGFFTVKNAGRHWTFAANTDAAPSIMKADIYSSMGRKVYSLENTSQQKGNVSVSWDGSDFSGNNVAPGAYTVRLYINGVFAERSIIVIR